MKRPLLITKIFTGILFVSGLFTLAQAQTFLPVPVSGFNQDVVAETGNSSLTTTTISIDGSNVSNKVIYTNTFKTLNGFGGGGIPDNGLITDASGSYQMADFSGNDALVIPRNQSGDLVIAAPSQFDHIRLLCLSTEGESLVNATLFFTDGSSTTALTNYPLEDWFFNTTNVVLSGFGRCTRATPATGDDAYPDNPRMYYLDIPLTCTDRQKILQRVNLSNVTTNGNNAPYPNAVFFALSATSYALSVTDAVSAATCSGGGSAALTITGSSAAYNVSWNTTPVQNGLTATNLSPGTYTATITDLSNCTSTHSVTIAQVNNLSITSHADTTICFGASFNANTISTATTYSWVPATGVSDPASANPVLSPVSTTTYTVTGTLGTCNSSASFTVTVDPQISVVLPAAASICAGNSYAVNVVSNATGFQWSPANGVSDPSVQNPVLSPASTTTYTVTASTGNCSVNGTFTLTVAAPAHVNAGSDVTIAAGQTTQLQGSGDAGTYLWSPSSGLSAVNVLNPAASPAITTTYSLQITNSLGCTGTDNVQVIVEGVPECGKPMNAITPNGDGINDKWLVTFGNCSSVARVKVFNRYGSQVYESDHYNNDWQGTYKGKSLPDGTYYFVIEYTLANGRNVITHGDLTILR